MRCACVDIGSNTTRLLVADVLGTFPREVLARKEHTHLGRWLRAGGGADVAARLAEVVAAQVGEARAAGARRLRVVATAAVRDAAGGDALCAAVRARAGVPVDVLTCDEEATLAFLGATRTAPPPPPPSLLPLLPLLPPPPGNGGGRGCEPPRSTTSTTPLRWGDGGVPEHAAVAVVDVGGGSVELAVGPLDGPPTWTVSLPLGSGTLADAELRSDPPTPAELDRVARAARAALATVDPPPMTRALAVGGSAASLARVLDGTAAAAAAATSAAGALVHHGDARARPLRLDAAGVAIAVATLTAAPAAEVAARTGLLEDRVRLLPAGLLLLAAASDRLGLPLELGCGGLREGVCLDLAL